MCVCVGGGDGGPLFTPLYGKWNWRHSVPSRSRQKYHCHRVEFTAERNLFGQMPLLSKVNGTDNEPLVLWTFGCVTIKTDIAKLICMRKVDDNFEKQGLSLFCSTTILTFSDTGNGDKRCLVTTNRRCETYSREKHATFFRCLHQSILGFVSSSCVRMGTESTV